MARRAGFRHRWLVSSLLASFGAVTFALHAAPASDAAAPIARTPDHIKKDKSIKMDKAASSKAPDAAVLDYLGRYGDAADGIDPLGFAAADAAAKTDGEHKERP